LSTYKSFLSAIKVKPVTAGKESLLITTLLVKIFSVKSMFKPGGTRSDHMGLNG